MGLFPLGKCVATPGAIQTLADSDQSPSDFIKLHHLGAWGDIDSDDKEANERALKEGGRIMSVYNLREGETIWIISEADRSVTTVLLPSEY